jgi:hypothetical protein
LTKPTTFTPNAPVLVDYSANEIIGQAGVSVLPDDTGLVQTQLIATDDPDLTPTRWNYRVVDSTGRKFHLTVPVNTPVLNSPGDPLDGEQVIELRDVVPVPGASGGVGQLIPGPQGPPGAEGSDTSGSLSSPEAVGDGLVVTITSNWGINVDGDPYYDPAGADPDEAAIATLDPFGHLVLTNAQGGAVVQVTSVNGRTGAVTLTKADVGLGLVDNTADTAKPVSTATQTALNLKANTAALATVATTGAYADLTGKPTIPSNALAVALAVVFGS